MGGEGVDFWEVFLGAGIAEGDEDVTEESFVFDSFDGGFGESLAKVFDGHVEEVGEGVVEDFLSGVEGGFAGEFGEAIPWAGVEAVVTAVDAVADGAAEFVRNGTFVFDGEVGDAAGGIELAGGGDCVGGAGGDAGGTFATVVG